MPKTKIAAEMVFQRHEKKYLLKKEQYDRLMDPLLETLERDQYGLHTIGSLYLDTEAYYLIGRSLDKPKYREKLRLRSYGVPGRDDTVFLELKKKLDGITYKRRTCMTLREAEAYLDCGAPPAGSGQILEEIDWFIGRYHPVPKVLLFYDRIALTDACGSGPRITFDTNIRWRTDNLRLSGGAYGAQLLAPGERLMEIKLNGAFPYWLSHLLSEEKIFPISFSKYGKVYQKYLCGNGMGEEEKRFA